ncbi:organic hydroperoxide resistance protein [Deinococcus sp. JMULE3]|uniref:organic hydroperoxide resistance protein n=1 Tax=Deinococcus sp. JMULE3 TaxID=2518341 RepID=UPI00157641BA|nr:organic hydroperoxide resistance protein [Deinococcus sp. JMULE3]NTY02381.1 organic hydroperoxide resistance protein [Deinococcus sp. JMULE3]
MKIFYKTRATATGGRSGRTALDDGSLAFDLAVPGSSKQGANPEQLFALGYAACFDNAMQGVAREMKLPAFESSTAAQVGIGQRPEGGYALDIDLDVTISGLDEATAQTLVDATHQVCPYSNATRGNVDVRVHVKVA